MAIIVTPPQPKRRGHGSPEARIQAECFQWLWNNHPETHKRYFAVLNENERADSSAITGAQRKARGVVAGVSDSLLLMARGKYHGLCCEFKTATGRQRDGQIEWQAIMESEGYYYFICRSKEHFIEVIEWYLSL